MDVDQVDLVAALTQQGSQFQDSWSKFMFNIEQAMELKKKKVAKEKLLEILTAGSAYLGGGWSTGKASKILYEMSSVAIVKSQIEPYRDTWLYCLALLWGIDLPTVDLPQECAEAAFALAHHYDHQEEQPREAPVAVSDSDEDDEPVRFGWEEEEQPLPRELLELWQRASSGTQRIEVRKLLELHPRLAQVPARAQENNLCPEHRKKADQFLKSVSQHLLNALRLMTYRWLRDPNPQLELQIWQYLAELHFKVMQERRELSVPGINRLASSSDALFTEEDVKAQRAENNIQRMSMVSSKKFSKVGGFSAQPSGRQSFLPSSPSAESSGSHYKSSWRGRGAGAHPRWNPKGGKGKSNGSSWKGSWKGSGKGYKGVSPSPSGHGGSCISPSGPVKGHGDQSFGHGGTHSTKPSDEALSGCAMSNTAQCRQTESSGPLPEAEGLHGLVGKTCPPVCLRSDQVGGWNPPLRKGICI